MSVSYPVERRDRPWLDSRVAYLIGPLDVPSVDRLREAVRRLCDAYPASRLNWRLDESRRRWWADRSPESIVTERIWRSDWSAADNTEAIRSDPTVSGPLALVRCQNHLCLVLSHAIGDGAYATAVLPAVLHGAIGGELAEWPHRSGRLPLLAAGMRTFGRHPSMIRTALDDRYPLAETAASGPLQPWAPSRRAMAASFPRALRDEMISTVAGLKPKVSSFALLTCAMLRALDDAGIAVSPDVNMMVDLRRYLGAGWIDGNLVAAVPMRIGADTTPQDFSAMIRTTMKSGRPLANAMLTSLRSGGRHVKPAPSVDHFDPHAPVRVTVTDLGNLPQLDRLPYTDEIVDYVGTGIPDGPHGVTFAFAHTAYSTTVTAAFHDNVIDPARMERALQIVTSGPAELITERSAGR